MIVTRTVNAHLTQADLDWLATGAFQFAVVQNEGRAVLGIDDEIAVPGTGYASRTFSTQSGMADWVNEGGSLLGFWPVAGYMLGLKFLFAPGEGGEGPEVPGGPEGPEGPEAPEGPEVPEGPVADMGGGLSRVDLTNPS